MDVGPYDTTKIILIKKAVKDGNVWYTGKNLYQATDTVGELISDIHLMLTDGDASQMTFLEKMK